MIHRLKYQFTCHAVIAISHFVRQLLAESGIPASMIEVIPDGIEFPREPPNADRRSRVRAQWGFETDDFVVGYMGGITAEKGQDLVIEALRLLEGSPSRARLVLGGEFSGSESALNTSLKPSLEGRVRRLGTIKILADFFAGLDLFTAPSRAEGLGSSALLAMAHGVPVVASRVGGLPEVVEDGRTGWLVPADSPAALAEAIATAALDRPRLRALGLQARERARQFGSSIMIERTEALYDRLVASQRLKVAG